MEEHVFFQKLKDTCTAQVKFQFQNPGTEYLSMFSQRSHVWCKLKMFTKHLLVQCLEVEQSLGKVLSFELVMQHAYILE